MPKIIDVLFDISLILSQTFHGKGCRHFPTSPLIEMSLPLKPQGYFFQVCDLLWKSLKCLIPSILNIKQKFVCIIPCKFYGQLSTEIRFIMLTNERNYLNIDTLPF